MKNQQLTDNFRLFEFTKGKPVGSFQLVLLKEFAKDLQTFRNMINQAFRKCRVDPNKEIGITISSGLRDRDDYRRLKRQGWHPSTTSDHFFGINPIVKHRLARLPLGASDIQLTNCKAPLKLVYKWAVDKDLNSPLKLFGQLIYEQTSPNGSEWLHLGASPKNIFVSSFTDLYTNRAKYLTSTDGGQSYTRYVPDNSIDPEEEITYFEN